MSEMAFHRIGTRTSFDHAVMLLPMPGAPIRNKGRLHFWLHAYTWLNLQKLIGVDSNNHKVNKYAFLSLF
jgi:hypothetical protein